MCIYKPLNLTLSFKKKKKRKKKKENIKLKKITTNWNDILVKGVLPTLLASSTGFSQADLNIKAWVRFKGAANQDHGQVLQISIDLHSETSTKRTQNQYEEQVAVASI